MLNITQSVIAAITLLLLVGCTSLLDTQLEETERTPLRAAKAKPSKTARPIRPKT